MPTTIKDIENLKKTIDGSMNDMYGSVYYSDPSITKTLAYMRTKTHRAIDGLMNSNISNVGTTNISSLIMKSKLDDMQNDDDVIHALNSTLENESLINSIMQSYTQNSWIRDMDREVDMVLKYMNKLEQALNCRREHVLCSDNFTNNQLHIRSRSAIGDDITANQNIQTMMKKYDLADILDKVYRKTDKYGECFIYIIPYKKAINRLLKQQGNIIGDIPTIKSESGMEYISPMNEAFTVEMNGVNGEIGFPNVDFSLNNRDNNFSLEMDKSGVIQSVMTNRYRTNSILNEAAGLAINEAAVDKNTAKASKEDKTSLDGEINKHKDDFYKLDGLSQDGVRTLNDFKPTENKNELKIPGAVIKILDRDMVKPLYIDDTCIGYFYIECDKKFDIEHSTFSSTIGGIRPGGMYRGKHKDVYFKDAQEAQLLKRLSMAISRKIDASFVNANQDLSKEIYAILKYNSTVNMEGKIAHMRVTYIPPEDIVHSFFEQDDETHRGISSLAKGLFPAKLWTCLLISNCLNILTRSNDERVYYVKQMVDTNISGVLINTINQIHRGNFGLRQIESMNNVLNILGRFNDLLVPKSPNGDSPIDVETIQGQNVDVKTELMNMLEEVAVQSTGVPYDYIQAHQSTDFATRLTMTNTRFLQEIYNTQARVKSIFSKILTKIYNAEFNSMEEIEYVPNVPTYLMCINTSQMINSANDIAQSVTDMYITDDVRDADVLKPRVMAEIKKKYTSIFFPANDMDEIIAKAQLALSKDKQQEE